MDKKLILLLLIFLKVWDMTKTIKINIRLPLDIWGTNYSNLVFALSVKLYDGSTTMITNLINIDQLDSRYVICYSHHEKNKIVAIDGFSDSQFYGVSQIYYIILCHHWTSGGICPNTEIEGIQPKNINIGATPGQEIYSGINPSGGIWCGIGFHINAPFRLVLRIQENEVYRILYMDNEYILTVFV